MRPQRVYGSVITRRGWGQTPQMLKQAKRHFLFAWKWLLVIIIWNPSRGVHSPRLLPKLDTTGSEGSYIKCRLCPRESLYWQTAGRHCVGLLFVRLPPPLQGRLDCILILGHSYMVAQTDRGHEPHRHYTLWTRSHLYMCVNGTIRCVIIIIIDISSKHHVAPDF